VFDAHGVMLGTASRGIEMWRPEPDFVEQSSDDIWAACGEAVRNAVAQAGVHPSDVRGIGFDATCSLVALDSAILLFGWTIALCPRRSESMPWAIPCSST
jgi:ribulose kinase